VPGGGPPGGGMLGGFPGADVLGGLFSGGGGPPRGQVNLDVNLTVEALMVSGAEGRDQLTDPAPWAAVDVEVIAALAGPNPNPFLAAYAGGESWRRQVLADPERIYTDLTGKNIFTGNPKAETAAKVTEDRDEVLSHVKLTTLSNSGRRWEAYFYDQGKGPPETRLNALILTDFTVADRYGNKLVEGKVVKVDEGGVVFQVKDDKNYYRWRIGEFIASALSKSMKEDELKDLGITPKDAKDK
jgi:hypothetical protein